MTALNAPIPRMTRGETNERPACVNPDRTVTQTTMPTNTPPIRIGPAARPPCSIADAMSDQVATKADLADLKADLTRFILTVATGQVALLLGAMFALARAGG